ncbi:DUF7541 family protein [Halarchaeum sp. P4]|uniref:DUF7541 family protein n=1 Tax=Halarchaeum sp. P4 TaxID=3421639 RepID=UPI003EB9DCFC
MEEQSGLSERYPTASPWPLFVALGLVLSEVGVFLGGVVLPVGIGGVLLLEASVVGIMRESGYANSLWSTSLGVGALVGVAGTALLVLTPYTSRALTLAGGGLLAVIAAVGLFLYESGYL